MPQGRKPIPANAPNFGERKVSNLDESTPTGRAKRPPVAIKRFVDVATPSVEVDIEKANGLAYQSLTGIQTGEDAKGNPIWEKDSNGEFKTKAGKEHIFDFTTLGLTTGSVAMMLALFGWSTLATNTASSNRNNKNAEDVAADDTDAVIDRWGRLEPNGWGNKGGGGFGIDIRALADSVARATNNAEMLEDGSEREEWIKLVESDPQIKRSFRNHTDVAPIYDEIMRSRRVVKDEKSLGDLMAGLKKPAPAA